MKKLIAVFMSFVLLLSICGCARAKEDYDSPTSFYYKSSSISFEPGACVISPEIRETKQFHSNISELINAYFEGPIEDDHLSLFPEGISVILLIRENEKLTLTVNDSLSSLTGLDLSIACACIGMTLLELTQCQEIEIISQGAQLDGKDSVTITWDDLYMFDESESAE